MQQEPERGGYPKSIGRHVWEVACRMNAVRPASFYLLLALFIMMPLGTRMAVLRDDPHKFALFVTLHLIFLFVVLVRAVFDLAEIAKEHFKERERLYGATLGDRAFARELGDRVSKHRQEP